MAEGFVRERRGMTPEEVAEEYFYELINRNLIEPSKIRVNGRIKSCRVHDIIRELLVAKSIEENLIFMTGQQENKSLVDNIHHLIIAGSNEIRRKNLHSIRSVSVFGADIPSHLSSPSNLKLLRVLDLNRAMIVSSASPLRNQNLKQAIRYLGQFEHLRYINMPMSFDTTFELPKSLGNLRGLQALDARNMNIKTVPNNITKLQNLRLLLFYKGVAMPKGIGNLKELQVLKWVNLERSNRRVVEELMQLKQLRKLGVEGLRREQYEKISTTISELRSLRSLGIEIEDRDKAAVGFLDSVASPPEHLRSINFKGWIGNLPAWISSLYKLTKVTLKWTKLDDDGIAVLEKLPNLLVLLLCGAYVGDKLTFRSTTFPKLRELYVRWFKNLKEFFFEEGTLMELQTLEIWYCDLKSVSGAEHLPRLTKLILGSYVYVANLDVLQKQVREHPNRPALEVRYLEYQKEKEDYYRGTTSGAPPADEEYYSCSDTEQIENS